MNLRCLPTFLHRPIRRNKRAGDAANGYYCVIKGDVCVYKHSDPAVDVDGLGVEATRCSCADTPEKRGLFGKLVAELEPRSAFGESPTARRATIIAGSWGPHNTHVGSAGVVTFHTHPETMLFVVPPHIFSAHLARDTSDPNWAEKMSYLKKNFLFAHMSDFERTQVANAMVKPHMKMTNSTVLSRFQQPIDSVVMLVSGEVKVTVPHEICEMCAMEAAEREESPIQQSARTKKHRKCKYTKTSTEIGRLYGPDVLFIEEMFDANMLAEKRVVCVSPNVSLYLVTQQNFSNWLSKAEDAKRESIRRRNDPTFNAKKFENWIVTVGFIHASRSHASIHSITLQRCFLPFRTTSTNHEARHRRARRGTAQEVHRVPARLARAPPEDDARAGDGHYGAAGRLLPRARLAADDGPEGQAPPTAAAGRAHAHARARRDTRGSRGAQGTTLPPGQRQGQLNSGHVW